MIGRSQGVLSRRATLNAAVRAIAIVIAFMAAGWPAVAAAEDNNSGAFRFGDVRGAITEVREPSSVAIAADGTIFVAQVASAEIGVFDPAGSLLAQWGGFGEGAGKFIAPTGIALADGEVFVSDAGLHRVQVFDFNGTFKRQWGTHGRGDGQFNQPAGIAVAGDRVYVADPGNNRVQAFDRQGQFQFTLGGPKAAAEATLIRPSDIAIDEEGSVFITDADANRILRFDAAGTFVKAWGDWGPFPGLLDEPTGLAYANGRLYVVDRRNHRVQMFDRSGVLLEEWVEHEVIPHEGNGRVHYPDDLAIAPDGKFAVLCEGIEHRCQIFDAARPDQQRPRLAYDRSKQTHFGQHVSISGKLMAIAEPENHFIYLFDIEADEVPAIINQFGERGEKFGLLMRAAGVHLDLASRTVLVSDTATRRLQQFLLDYDPDQPLRYDPQMTRFARSWSFDNLREMMGSASSDWPIEPAAIRRHPNGELFVIDARNARILVFGPEMEFRRTWGTDGSGPGEFRQPTDLAFSIDGKTVFIVDSLNRRVQVFDLAGTFQFAFGQFGEAAQQFLRPFGIACAENGSLYVTDAATDRVQKFAADGTFISQWGSRGTRMGQLWKPMGIELDTSGRVFVIDMGNHRGQIFSADGEWLVTFSAGLSYTRTLRPRDEQ